MRRWWILVGLAGCRQIFGIDEPAAITDGPKSAIDGHLDSHVGAHDAISGAPGLAMFVEKDIELWTTDESPDNAWALTNPAFAVADVWSGSGPTVASLAFDGVLSGHPFSVWMEGQVYADQGTQRVQAMANDYAFFDVELIPNSGSFAHVVTCTGDLTQNKAISMPFTGWYRVRIGWASSGTSPDFAVLHEGPVDNSLSLFDTTNLRH